MRVWELRFQVYKSLPDLPIPHLLVEEIQDNPSYKLFGMNRKGDEGCQLVYTLEGEGRFKAGKTEYALLPGKAFLAQHCDPETSYYYPPEGKGIWRFLWVAFGGRTVPQMVNSIVRAYGYVFDLPRDKGIINELEAYRSYREGIWIFTPLEGAKFVMNVIASIGEFAGTKPAEFSKNKLVKEAQSFIIENIAGEIGTGKIASRPNISREHLSRIFHCQTGISLKNYIVREKLRLACSLLKETKLECKQIAGRVGYVNATSFNRVFKKTLKMSPLEFRNIGHLPESF